MAGSQAATRLYWRLCLRLSAMAETIMLGIGKGSDVLNLLISLFYLAMAVTFCYTSEKLSPLFPR